MIVKPQKTTRVAPYTILMMKWTLCLFFCGNHKLRIEWENGNNTHGYGVARWATLVSKLPLVCWRHGDGFRQFQLTNLSKEKKDSKIFKVWSTCLSGNRVQTHEKNGIHYWPWPRQGREWASRTSSHPTPSTRSEKLIQWFLADCTKHIVCSLSVIMSICSWWQAKVSTR